MNRNIILVGMPACGKSIVGVVLAKTLRKSFVDTDLLIQEREKQPLQQIIDYRGNGYFKEVEEQVLLDLDISNAVISTGGSAIYYPRVINHFKKSGIVVYIKVSLNTIENRLKNIKTRGVTLAPGETIADLYDRRIPLYEKHADITIEAETFTVEETVTAIAAYFKE